MADNRVYICIDLKSFYASVECIERDLDPLTTNLVVADASSPETTVPETTKPATQETTLTGTVKASGGLSVRKVKFGECKVQESLMLRPVGILVL